MSAPNVDLIAALEKALGRTLPAPRRPRHPEPGCNCDPCIRRDEWLESRAEERAERRRGDY